MEKDKNVSKKIADDKTERNLVHPEPASDSNEKTESFTEVYRQNSGNNLQASEMTQSDEDYR